MAINEDHCISFGNGRKVTKLWIITLQFQLKKQNKVTSLTLTFSFEKGSCLIRSKKKKVKPKTKKQLNK